MLKRLTALLLSSVFLISGCQNTVGESGESGSYHFTDALGQEVAIATPERVAALMGGFAETWLLAGGNLAATTEDAITERSLSLADDIVNLGFYNTPSLEALLEVSPDLVLLSSETPAHVALGDMLRSAGITTAYFNVTHFADYLDMLAICTDISGRKDLYQEYGLKVKTEIDALLASIPNESQPTVLLLITHSGGTAVQNAETMTGRMLQELGAINLADQYPSLLSDLNMEYIMEADPDYIFIIPMGNSDGLAQQHLAALIETHPAWSSLSAVQNDRLILLPKEGFLYKPNATWAESYRYLIEVLYD